MGCKKHTNFFIYCKEILTLCDYLNRDIMTTTLNLSIEEKVAKRIKKYADVRKTSVSSIAESLFLFITAESKESNEREISPLVKSFSIDNVKIPVNFDYKEELANSRNEKYL